MKPSQSNSTPYRNISRSLARLLAALCCLLLLASAGAQERSSSLKPKWMTSSLPEPKSNSYIFMLGSGSGNSLEAARQNCFVNLTSRLEHERGITVESTVEAGSRMERNAEGITDYSSHRDFSMRCTEKGKTIYVNGREIDEYWERSKADGTYHCTILYTVADHNSPGGSYDDEITLTTRYGLSALSRSLLPGWGQFYKGHNKKALCIIGGEALLVGGIIASESMRASYVKKKNEQPALRKDYSNKASNCENIRNVCIGAAAALYVYNLIDAVATGGARRVRVRRKNSGLALYPVATPEWQGFSLSCRF